MIKFLKSLFVKDCIGSAILKPWKEYKFSSSRMTPRFDNNGNIYMLVCDENRQ